MKRQKGFVEVLVIYAVFVLLAGSHILATKGEKHAQVEQPAKVAQQDGK